MWAVWLVVNAVAVAVKVALGLFAGTETEGGTPRFWLSVDSPTVAPPVAPRVTVHVVDAEGASVLALQARLVGTRGVAAGEMTPPVPTTLTALPSTVEPSGLVTPMARLFTPGAMTTDATATGPSGMAVVVIPYKTQIVPVEFGAQARVIPAEESALAAETLNELTLAAVYVKVHCSAEEVLPGPDARDKVNGTVVPEIPVAEERLSVDWPHSGILQVDNR
jgi:hypothetical protein